MHAQKCFTDRGTHSKSLESITLTHQNPQNLFPSHSSWNWFWWGDCGGGGGRNAIAVKSAEALIEARTFLPNTGEVVLVLVF